MCRGELRNHSKDFSKNVFLKIFISQTLFFPIFFFSKFFSGKKILFSGKLFLKFSILGRFRSWGPVPLGDVTVPQLLVEGYRSQKIVRVLIAEISDTAQRIFFCSKIIFEQKLFSYCWGKFDFPGSIVYLFCCSFRRKIDFENLLLKTVH